MLIFKMILLIILGVIVYEDITSRMVHWILFPLATFFLGYSFFEQSNPIFFLTTVGMNILLVSGIMLILFLYAKLIMKKPFLNTSFGLGDLLFFYAISVAFPTVTFIVLFVFALIFSLCLHLVRKRKDIEPSVPLAGYMALFFAMILGIHMISNQPNLYQF